MAGGVKVSLSKIRFFATPEDFRKWLKTHHGNTSEQWVGFYKKGSGRPSITWPESVDEALCVGWIDGLRKTIDAESYMIRFTPRKKTSNWSAVNIGAGQGTDETGTDARQRGERRLRNARKRSRGFTLTRTGNWRSWGRPRKSGSGRAPKPGNSFKISRRVIASS